ncbi:TetR/AcrR family transcriptional regulator [Salininema proteolyticum]|uniref:TetR/AcrR family transcriptional regulator n=1 Tax=Salininema proteolyticum TaxID=1607685 RepID=A0ABV8TWP3_9ACTN
MGKSRDTRRALLSAARAEFAAHGLAGSRVDRIAERAGVNKERIYALFGSKDRLFDEVLREVTQEFIAVVNPHATDTTASEYVDRHYVFHRDHPDLIRLLMWEALDRGGDLAKVDSWRRDYYAEKRQTADERFGLSDEGEAARLALALCGLAAWSHAMPQLRFLLLGEHSDDEAYKRLVLDFIDHAMGMFDDEGSGRDGTSAGAEVEAEVPPKSAVDEALDELAKAQEAERRARDRLADALRAENSRGESANSLAKRAKGLVSRPVVLRMLAGED